jgi:hypothetical protein
MRFKRVFLVGVPLRSGQGLKGRAWKNFLSFILLRKGFGTVV